MRCLAPARLALRPSPSVGKVAAHDRTIGSDSQAGSHRIEAQELRVRRSRMT
jgi:hypothetical protein